MIGPQGGTAPGDNQTWYPTIPTREPTSQEMDIFERREIGLARPHSRMFLNMWYNWLVDHIPRPIRTRVNDAFGSAKSKIMGLYRKVARPPYKAIELEKAFDGAYRSCRIYGKPKLDVYSFFNKVRGELIDIIKKELQTGRSAKIQTTIWIRFAKDDEKIDMPFNSLMMNVHRGSEWFLL